MSYCFRTEKMLRTDQDYSIHAFFFHLCSNTFGRINSTFEIHPLDPLVGAVWQYRRNGTKDDLESYTQRPTIKRVRIVWLLINVLKASADRKTGSESAGLGVRSSSHVYTYVHLPQPGRQKDKWPRWPRHLFLKSIPQIMQKVPSKEDWHGLDKVHRCAGITEYRYCNLILAFSITVNYCRLRLGNIFSRFDILESSLHYAPFKLKKLSLKEVLTSSLDYNE